MDLSRFDTLCRLCLRNSFYYMHIYVGQSIDRNPIYEVLNYVYGLEVFVDDGLPEYICRDCLLKLKEFETYKRKAHRAKSELLSLKGNVEESCVKKEIDEEEFADQQLMNQATIKDETEEENLSPPMEERNTRLEVYIKQEKIDDEYLPSGGERLEESSLDEEVDSQMCSMMGAELTTGGTSSSSEGMDNNKLCFGTTKRGGRKLILSGFIYHFHRKGKNNSTQWMCQEWDICNAHLILNDDETFRSIVNKHSHFPRIGEAKAAIAMAEFKEKVKSESHLAPSVLTQELLANVDSETIQALPSGNSLMRVISTKQQWRIEVQPTPWR